MHVKRIYAAVNEGRVSGSDLIGLSETKSAAYSILLHYDRKSGAKTVQNRSYKPMLDFIESGR